MTRYECDHRDDASLIVEGQRRGFAGYNQFRARHCGVIGLGVTRGRMVTGHGVDLNELVLRNAGKGEEGG